MNQCDVVYIQRFARNHECIAEGIRINDPFTSPNFRLSNKQTSGREIRFCGGVADVNKLIERNIHSLQVMIKEWKYVAECDCLLVFARHVAGIELTEVAERSCIGKVAVRSVNEIDK